MRHRCYDGLEVHCINFTTASDRACSCVRMQARLYYCVLFKRLPHPLLVLPLVCVRACVCLHISEAAEWGRKWMTQTQLCIYSLDKSSTIHRRLQICVLHDKVSIWKRFHAHDLSCCCQINLQQWLIYLFVRIFWQKSKTWYSSNCLCFWFIKLH